MEKAAYCEYANMGGAKNQSKSMGEWRRIIAQKSMAAFIIMQHYLYTKNRF